MERSSAERQTMALNQFSRHQFKRREGSGRLTTKRPIRFDNLLLSGKKPLASASSSLYKNISTTLKENVNPESRISQNVDDFWAVERQKRISAVARRKLTGQKETTQEITQPVEDRKARHARSRRVGGSRAVGAKPKKLDVYIDAELIADWDKENLEVEEEIPCTIASSEAFMSAQGTALRASLQVRNTMDPRVEAVPGTCSPAHTQVDACKVDGEPKAQTPGHDGQATDAKSSSSLEDMDLCSGESPDSLIQNMMNQQDRTPDLASLVEMDWNTSCPQRGVSESALNSQDNLRYQLQDATGIMLDTERQPFSPRLDVPPDKPRGDCLVAETHADPVSNAHLRSQQFEHEGRVNEVQGYISSLLMQCNLDKDVSCTNHDGTPLHDTQSQRTRLPTTSPTPPSNPFAVYMSRRQLLNETGEFSQRKLAFGSCSPSSSLDFGEDFQNKDIPDTEIDWDKISCHDDPHYVDAPERDHEVANTHCLQNTSEKRWCSGLSFPHDGSTAQKVQVVTCQGTETERYVRDVIQSQESCSMHVKMSNVKSESRRKSGSDLRTESLRDQSKESPGVDGPRTSTVMPIKPKQADKDGLPNAVKALFSGDKGAETPSATKLHVSGFKSDKTKQEVKVDLNAGKALGGLNEDTPGFDEPPLSPIKSLTTKQVEKTRLSSAAKSLKFEDEDKDSCGIYEAPVSASRSVKEKQAENTGPSSAAKALDFEDTEATLDGEEAESLVQEPLEATELGVSLPVEVKQNTARSCANLQREPDDIQAEITTCANFQSQPNDITVDTQPCTNPASQADNATVGKLQSEPRQHPQAKKPRRRKVQDRRSSLEGSENGCTWNGGQRRSQRIRVRPLEWWRGEKLLYGRVHDSLTSVIGIKQSSPGQYARGIKAPFVVQSFVPAKYNELVRFAAI